MCFALGRAPVFVKPQHAPRMASRVLPLLDSCLGRQNHFYGLKAVHGPSERLKGWAMHVSAGDHPEIQYDQPGAGKDGGLARSTALETSEKMLVLPPPRDAKVKTAKYVSSSVALSQCPPTKLPEFAVIGRSNVGKSSLINMLTGSKSLALTSKQPGTVRVPGFFCWVARSGFRHSDCRIHSQVKQ
jgi:hypothetical protein